MISNLERIKLSTDESLEYYSAKIGDITIIASKSKLDPLSGIYIITNSCHPYLVRVPLMSFSLALGTISDYSSFGWLDIMWMVNRRRWDYCLISVLIYYFDEIMLLLPFLKSKDTNYNQCEPWIILLHQLYSHITEIIQIMDASLSSRTKEVEISRLVDMLLLKNTFIEYELIQSIIKADEEIKRCETFGIQVRL